MSRLVAVLIVALCPTSSDGSSAEESFARARQALELHDLAGARMAVQECLKLSPKHPSALALAGEIESQIGLDLAASERFSDARDHFREVTRLQPRFAGGYYNLGLVLLNLSDAAGAERAFRQALKLSPEHAKASAQLANVVLAQARTDRARMAEASAALRQAIQLSPANPALHFNLAYALAVLADDPGALAEYREVFRREPKYPALNTAMAYTFYRLSDWDAAEKHFRDALADDQDDYTIHYYLGCTLAKTGNISESRLHLEKAVNLDPEQPGPHFQLAALDRAVGKSDRAAVELRSFLELTAKAEIKWRNEALETSARAELGRGDLNQGIVALTQAFQNRPSAATARNIGLACLENGDLAQARTWLEKALVLAPNDSGTHNFLGLLEARRGNLPLAQEHFDTAARLDTRNSEASYNAGVAALELGKIDPAIQYFEKALQNSDEPRLHEGLAAALSAAGRHEEAQKHFDAAHKKL